MQQTISQAARLYGKARSTIHRAIDAGRLSCTVRGDGVRVVDLSELIRLWGEPQSQAALTQQDATSIREGAQQATQQAMLEALQAMHRELVKLREEVAELKRLPAPPAASNTPELSERYDGDVQAQGDDPHGLRALVQAMRDEGKEK